MLSLYLVWFIIEIPFIYLRFFHHQELLHATRDFIVGLLFHNTFFAFWFITASCQAMLIVWLLAKRSNMVLYLTGLASFGLFVSMGNEGAKITHQKDGMVSLLIIGSKNIKDESSGN